MTERIIRDPVIEIGYPGSNPVNQKRKKTVQMDIYMKPIEVGHRILKQKGRVVSGGTEVDNKEILNLLELVPSAQEIEKKRAHFKRKGQSRNWVSPENKV